MENKDLKQVILINVGCRHIASRGYGRNCRKHNQLRIRSRNLFSHGGRGDSAHDSIR